MATTGHATAGSNTHGDCRGEQEGRRACKQALPVVEAPGSRRCGQCHPADPGGCGVVVRDSSGYQIPQTHCNRGEHGSASALVEAGAGSLLLLSLCCHTLSAAGCCALSRCARTCAAAVVCAAMHDLLVRAHLLLLSSSRPIHSLMRVVMCTVSFCTHMRCASRIACSGIG
jgi:hypothetical protein